MSASKVVVRVLNAVGPTSSPFNQFSLYRTRTYPEERNIIISLFAAEPTTVEHRQDQPFAGRLRVYSCGGNVGKLVRVVHTILAELKREGLPTLFHLHHPTSAAIVQLSKLALLRDVPVVYTVHSTFSRYSARNRALTRLNVGLADRVTFVSDASLRAFPETVARRKGAALTVIPNGVDLERIDEVLAGLAFRRADAGEPDSRLFRLITVGRMVEAKNQPFLIELMAKLPDHITLTIVGDGSRAEELRKKALDLGVSERIHFTGIVPRNEVFREMQRADAFVSSSFWEGLPVAVLEAMAVGLPVVLSDIGPHREVAARGSSVAILPLEINAWVDGLTRLSQKPSPYLAALGRENRHTVETHFTLAHMQEAYTRIYKELWFGGSRA